MNSSCAVYRHFDQGGNLLYVGMSGSVFRRLQSHIHQSHWAGQVARIEIQHCASRAEAAEVERQAIRTERPAHNVNGFAETQPKKRGPSKGSGGRPSKYPAPTDDQMALLEKWWAGPLHWENVAALAGEMLKCETPERNWMLRQLGNRPPCEGRARKRRSDAGSKRNPE